MDNIRNVLRLFVVMLFSAFGASMAFAVPMGTFEITFHQTENTTLSQAADVGFAARETPLAVSNVAITGDVAVIRGSAFALRGQETVASLFGFSADHTSDLFEFAVLMSKGEIDF